MIGITPSGVPSDQMAPYRALARLDFGGVQVTSPQRCMPQPESGDALHKFARWGRRVRASAFVTWKRS